MKTAYFSIDELAETVLVPSVRFDELELTVMLHRIYLKMFEFEDISKMVSKLDIQKVQNSSRSPYLRETFAALLFFIKQREVVSD